MRNQSVLERVRAQAQAALGDDTLMVEDVKVSAAGAHSLVRITIDLADGPGGVDLDQIGEISQKISAGLDTIADDLPARYTLEVTTPGATRWLKTPRHYRRTAGHDVEFWVDGTRHIGAVTEADDQQVCFIVNDERTCYPYSRIEKARIHLAL
ncbi:MAG: ribosome maturation factor RimP [Bowdeniella nasicola]|nr:ribosome maturation factor RimP [Bowdeniella nasicola]